MKTREEILKSIMQNEAFWNDKNIEKENREAFLKVAKNYEEAYDAAFEMDLERRM